MTCNPGYLSKFAWVGEPDVKMTLPYFFNTGFFKFMLATEGFLDEGYDSSDYSLSSWILYQWNNLTSALVKRNWW